MPEPQYGLECKAPWCDKILTGEKTIEMRRYQPPPDLMGRKVWLLASSGEENIPSLGDEVPAGSHAANIVGTVVFNGVKEYSSFDSWVADTDKHCVPKDSPYAYQGVTYGWIVGDTERLAQPQPLPHMKRVIRSIYETTAAPPYT